MTGLALTCLGCTTRSQSDEEAQGTVGRTKYSVPLEFSPEPGELDEGRGVQLIDDPELSVLVTGDMLADAISGFDPRHLGAIHDTMVIVQNFSEEEVGDWSPTDVMIRNREDIWRREGHMASACIDDEPDPLTGLIRYTTLCDPEPQPRSSFFLLDRRPEPGQKRPDSQEYIRATCSISESFRLPDAGQFYKCIHTRSTPWGDHFQFRLSGENVALMDEVEAYLQSLLLAWREDDRGRMH